jgi:hypothetical protein
VLLLTCLPLDKALLRAGIPPVLEVANAVELGSLVVEAVRDFVSNHCTDAAVIDRLREGLVEEGRLQNGSRESWKRSD